MKTVKEVVEELKEKPAETIDNWRNNPVAFCEDVLRFKPLNWQKKLLMAIADAKFGRQELTRFAIKSGVGVGKTACVSAIVLWNLAVFKDAKVPCTAPTSPQLKAVLWPEIKKWIFNIPPELREFFPFDHQTDRVTCNNNFAVARTARDEAPESFQGYHALNPILIADEASGVADAIFMAGQGVMSEKGAITILIGNPTRAAGFFYDCFNANSARWWTMTVRAFDSERVSQKFIDEMKAEHGENSFEYKVRVLGEFCLEDSGVIIPRPWVDEAIDRELGPDSDYRVWGFDVSDGRDRSAVASRMGNRLEFLKSWGGKSALQSVGIVADMYFEADDKAKPDEICVDAIGMGATAAQRLAEVLKDQPVRVTKVNVARTGAEIGERFTSFRVELWDRGRKWFESGLCSIPSDLKRFYAQISSVEWEVKDSNGKWAIVDKKASGSSPDEADAFLLTFGGLKRGKSSFTKNKDKRTIQMESRGIGSASYL